MPARVVLGLLTTSLTTGEVASQGLKAIEATADTDTTGAKEAWERALAELPSDPRPVLFSTLVDTATYLEVLAATQAHRMSLDQGMVACFYQGLKTAG